MFLYVVTKWPCGIPGEQQTPCEGSLIVTSITVNDDENYSITCSKCGMGTSGAGTLPEFWINKLIENGYIRQLSRRPVTEEDLFKFFSELFGKNRTPNEIAGDVLENFEVFHR